MSSPEEHTDRDFEVDAIAAAPGAPVEGTGVEDIANRDTQVSLLH
jgi:hypothetical protein